ncbi:HAD domain-containing protein [Paraburkholderia sp. A1BS-2L]|uniref:HAD domain-containing protein n=1 Tax=Paraburkholderia sp. A1BS-2L TaxID=3028373 RepID=UPI003DA9D611
MKHGSTNWKLNPKAPTLYIGFGGVLNVGEGLVDRDGNVSLDSGRPPFEFVPYLIDVLAPYPGVQLILTTTWTATLGEARTAELLPVELSARVVGTTLHYPPRFGEVRAGFGRTMSILRHAAAYGIETWLALSDDYFSLPFVKESNFLRVPSDTALGTPIVRIALREWLAANAIVSNP